MMPTSRAIEAVSPLAPLHNPPALDVLKGLRKRFPGVPQVACFDTAFHRGHPAVADRFAIPDALYQEGVRRYGFHGLSYTYIAGALKTQAPEIAAGRVVVAHLGSGASMCGTGRRAQRRFVDGLHRAGRAADGHPVRLARLRRDPVAAAAERLDASIASSTSCTTIAA